MLERIVQRPDGYVEIRFQERAGYISCQVFYEVEEGQGRRWRPASLYPALDAEFVLNGCDYLWNEALTSGLVRLSETKEPAVWWNVYLNLGRFEGEIRLKVAFLTKEGCYEDTGGVVVADRGVVYLNRWDDYTGEHASPDPRPGDRKWAIRNDRDGPTIGMKHKEQLPPIRVPLPVSGVYDIYFGLKQSGAHFMARIDDEPFSRIITPGNTESLTASHFKAKLNKELFWKRRHLRNGSLEIAQLRETINRDYDFGRLSYIKLVPGEERSFSGVSVSVRSKIPELMLYYEPYSHTMHGFTDAETMNGVMLEEFLRLEPREITCQAVRVGMKAQYWSRFLERVDQAAKDDSNQEFGEPMKLLANCDILRESLRYLRDKGSGVRFTANVGMNRPYMTVPALSEKFARDHPEYVKNGDFNYAIPEVRAYAKSILRELIEDYDIDGLFLDYMRHFRNQTEETVLELVRDVRIAMDEKGRKTGNRLELKIRLPADQLEYYRAMERCVAERLVDGIVPSNVVTAEPLPPIEHYQRLCRGTGTKVYGCIDGWRWMLGATAKVGIMRMGHSPESVTRYVEHYDRLGADGIFIYGGDLFTGNPYLADLLL